MNFTEIAKTRQSCRNYDSTREVEEEKIERILEAGRLSPSACNGQPYFITVCKGEAAKNVVPIGIPFASQMFVIVIVPR